MRDRETKLVEETQALRTGLKASRAQAELLERQLRKQEEALRRAGAAHGPGPAPQAATASADASAASLEEQRRLRAKVAELKGLLKESHTERSALRGQLVVSTARLDVARNPDSEPSAPAVGPSAIDDVEGDVAVPGRLPLLVPVYTDGAAVALREAPARLGRDAVRRVADVASGDEAAWRTVKQLRSARGLLSARVGIHHRILFRTHVQQGQLEVVAFIARKDLEVTLKRLS